VEQRAGWLLYPKYRNDFEICADYYRLQGVYSYFVRHIFNYSGLNREEEFKELYHSPLMQRNRLLGKQVNAKNKYNSACATC